MEKQLNLRHKVGQGISPRKFMEGMQVRVMELSNIQNTKERFFKNYEEFVWRNEDAQSFFAGLRDGAEHHQAPDQGQAMHCLILCTDWCPDVIWNVPVLFRMMEQSGIPTEVLVMEEHLETMDLFLIDGGRAQPIAVFLNGNGDVLGKWGARPAYIQAVMDEFKQNHPDKTSSEYQENIKHVYRAIGELYHDGNKYQDVMIDELRDVFRSFTSPYMMQG